MNKIIFPKRSRTEINFLSSVLSRGGIKNKIINTPMRLQLSCGLSVLIDEGDFNRAQSVVAQNGLSFDAIFRVVETPYGSNYQKIQ